VASYVVAGAGVVACNGTYNPSGTFGGKTSYVLSTGGKWIWWKTYFGATWVISDNKGDSVLERYYRDDGGANPDDGVWSLGAGGSNPVPTVADVEAGNGNGDGDEGSISAGTRIEIESKTRVVPRLYSVPVPFVARDSREGEILADVYGRLPTDLLSRLAEIEKEIVDKLQKVTIVERFDDITHAVDGAWTDVELAAYGVVDDDECFILFQNNVAASNVAGVRAKGSGIDRRLTNGGGMGNNTQMILPAIAGPGAVIEVYLEDASDFKVYLVQYRHYSTG